MKNVKKALVVAIGGAAILGAAAAQALTVTPGYGTYTFSGPTTLTYLGIPVACTLELTGDVQPTASGGLDIIVNDGKVIPGSTLCNQVSLEFPWYATFDGANVPTDPNVAVGLTFTNVKVTAMGATCGSSSGNSVPAIYQYGNPASPPSTAPAAFSFNASIGLCGVNGVLNETTGTLVITNP